MSVSAFGGGVLHWVLTIYMITRVVLDTLVEDFDLRAGYVTLTVPDVEPATDYSIVREWFFFFSFGGCCMLTSLRHI